MFIDNIFVEYAQQGARTPISVYACTAHTLIGPVVLIILVSLVVVFAVYNAAAKLNQWCHLALSSELPGANSSITSETF